MPRLGRLHGACAACVGARTGWAEAAAQVEPCTPVRARACAVLAAQAAAGPRWGAAAGGARSQGEEEAEASAQGPAGLAKA
eukprot:366017-Chlamydomonas_euryale.AAC.14